MKNPCSEEGPIDTLYSDVYSEGFRSWGLGSIYQQNSIHVWQVLAQKKGLCLKLEVFVDI